MNNFTYIIFVSSCILYFIYIFVFFLYFLNKWQLENASIKRICFYMLQIYFIYIFVFLLRISIILQIFLSFS